jgi:ubiquinone/menaquinone biosynthesis C-methylase UbiE
MMAPKQTFFDSRASDWEETCYPEPVRARLQELTKEFGVRRGEHVLDVGTGPGVLIPYLRARTGPPGRICAFDLSFEMTKQANRKERASDDMVIRADVHRIPFGDNAFDRVICFAAFPHFHDPGQAVHEMARVLKPEGELIIAHLMSREELARHHGGHEAVARDVLPGDRQMASLFLDAMLSRPDILNRPGRYLARGRKSYER